MDEKEAAEIRRKAAEVVGDYSPPRSWPASILKWTIGALLGVAAMLVVMGTLNKYKTLAQTAPAPKKPVAITIVPSR